MYKNALIALLTTVCVSPISALAEINFKGFASAGGGIFSEDDFIYDDVSDSINTDLFTKFALQVNATINESTTFTGQLVARGSQDYQLEAEWAYVTINISDNLDFRAGRLRAPFFLYSDFLDVGYAYQWVRPPSEVYRVPLRTVEGFDVLYNHLVGDWSASLQIYYGGLTDKTGPKANPIDITIEDFTGINYKLSNDWLTVGASYNQGTSSLSTPAEAASLLSALEAGGFSSVAAALPVFEEDTVFYGVGLNIDLANVIVASEYTVRDIGDQSFVSNDDAWYIMFGYRIGSFTPHITYAQEQSDPDYSLFDTIPDSSPLRGVVLSAIEDIDDTNLTLGLRYDYGPSSAFKVDISMIEQKNNDLDGTLVAFSYDVVF